MMRCRVTKLRSSSRTPWGMAAQKPEEDVVVTDTLPAGLAYVAAGRLEGALPLGLGLVVAASQANRERQGAHPGVDTGTNHHGTLIESQNHLIHQ